MEQSVINKYQPVIGIEVHAQLLTKSKMYASDPAEYGGEPNSRVGIVTLAHPGTLPVLNKKAIEFAVRMGLACDAEITRECHFDRKNYFYPDLPKGFQITQDKTPICRGGGVTIKKSDGTEKFINLTRIHLEEDAGKSMHIPGETDTLVDLNRAGTPLIEIVTEPELRSAEEAYLLLTEIRKLVRYLDICDGNMEEGSLRCDANISVMLKGASEFGKKVEVKNMNSVRNVRTAIEHEIERQIKEIEKGNEIISETRNFDAASGTTSGMRTKEALNDYRYFPEPDLPPFIVSDDFIEKIRSEMPSLPKELHKKFIETYGLSEYDTQVLTESKEIALYFDKICEFTTDYKAASNRVTGDVKSYLNEKTLHIDQFPVTPKMLAELINLTVENKVSNSVASQRIFPEMINHPEKSPRQIAEELDLLQENDESVLAETIEAVLAKFPAKVAEYQSGKKGLLGMFMGEIMAATKGKADPKLANKLLAKRLNQ